VIFSRSAGPSAGKVTSWAGISALNSVSIQRVCTRSADGVLTPMKLPLLGNPDPSTVSHDADPTSRFCDPKDVANLVLFLISDESRFISGAQLRITNAH
jgi:NAD(P)-dependent dehydrogenase (short-subunit alcohol dehydrogenase family)